MGIHRFDVGDEVTNTLEHLPEDVAAAAVGTVLEVTRHGPPAQASAAAVRSDMKLVGGDRVTVPESGVTY